VFSLEPEMGDLVTNVIPKIKAEWEDVAYALGFKIAAVTAIKEDHQKNAKKCCRELFIEWLDKGHGISPKTWTVLIEKLKKIELVKAAEEIVEELLATVNLK